MNPMKTCFLVTLSLLMLLTACTEDEAPAGDVDIWVFDTYSSTDVVVPSYPLFKEVDGTCYSNKDNTLYTVSLSADGICTE